MSDPNIAINPPCKPLEDVPSDCSGCTFYRPHQFIVENPNVSDWGCSNSADVNAEANRTTTYVDHCTWKGPNFTACNPSTSYWLLSYDDLSTQYQWTLTVADTNAFYYASGSFDGSLGFTLNGPGGGSEFSGWPSTLTVTPKWT